MTPSFFNQINSFLLVNTLRDESFVAIKWPTFIGDIHVISCLWWNTFQPLEPFCHMHKLWDLGSRGSSVLTKCIKILRSRRDIFLLEIYLSWFSQLDTHTSQSNVHSPLFFFFFLSSLPSFVSFLFFISRTISKKISLSLILSFAEASKKGIFPFNPFSLQLFAIASPSSFETSLSPTKSHLLPTYTDGRFPTKKIE